MKNLLKQWAELEPERCYWYGDNNESLYFVYKSEPFRYYDNYDIYTITILEAAVREAIEARGLAWTVKYYRIKENPDQIAYECVLYLNEIEMVKIDGGESVLHMMLTAYINLLNSLDNKNSCLT